MESLSTHVLGTIDISWNEPSTVSTIEKGMIAASLKIAGNNNIEKPFYKFGNFITIYSFMSTHIDRV